MAKYFVSMKPSRPAMPHGIPADAEEFSDRELAVQCAVQMRGYVIDETGTVIEDKTFIPPPNGYFNFIRGEESDRTPAESLRRSLQQAKDGERLPFSRMWDGIEK